MRLVMLLLTSLALAGMAGASTRVPSDGPGPTSTATHAPRRSLQTDPAAASVVAGNNLFAFEFYSKLRENPGNILFSPLSISTAFAMARVGAAGATSSEIDRVFHFPSKRGRTDLGFEAVIGSLQQVDSLGGCELAVSDRVWPQVGFSLLSSFVDTLQTHYGAPVQSLDFETRPALAAEAINSSVSRDTHGRIPELLHPGSLDSLTRLVLTNAVYFRGQWESQFDPKSTSLQVFHRSSIDSSVVRLMQHRLTARAAHLPSDSLTIVELPYKGREISMLGLLPDRIDGLAALETRLTAARLAGWLDNLNAQDVFLALPHFIFQTPRLDLIPILRLMGLVSPFDRAKADFSAMDGRSNFWIGLAVHRGFLEVDERGSEATAATAVGGFWRSTTNTRRVALTFYANHPFIFLIKDNVTGAYIFMGRVVDPKS